MKELVFVESISSFQNSRVKQAVKWRDRPDRDQDQVVLIEGYRALTRALSGEYPVREVYVCPEYFQGENEEELLLRLQARGAKLYRVAPGPFAKMAYRDRPEGLLGVGPQVRRRLEDLPAPAGPAGFYLLAEQTEKPGNLGTMLRSADAVRLDGLILCDSRTDLYNPNVVRASTGSLFTLPIAEAGSAEALAWLQQRNIAIVSASPHARQLYSQADLTVPLAIVVGAEQFGLSDLWLQAATVPVRLPMFGEADSLNVATATALLLYEVVRQRLAAGLLQDPGPVPESADC